MPNPYVMHDTPLDESQFGLYIISNLVLHVLMFLVIIVIPLTMVLILIHNLAHNKD